MTIGLVFAWISVAAGSYMLIFTVANIIYLLLVSRLPGKTEGPRVSVLIPARNEAKRIGPTLEALEVQDYSDFEVLILDDNSDDGTNEIIAARVAGDSRFRCIRGRSLPEKWKGKPFAMQQLIGEAGGEILLFIDADMRPAPDLISWTVANMENHEVDFLSGYARHTSPEKTEYLLFPVMYLATSFLLPLWLFNHSRSYMLSHAIGQYFCVRSSVMEEVGGFEPVRDKINEDIQMARFLKGRGYRQVFLDAGKHISGNMYDSIEHARMGVMRVVYEYFDNLIYPFIFMGFVMVVFLLAPIPMTVVAAIAGWPSAAPLALSITLVVTAWCITMINRRMPWYTGLLYPVHFSWVIILSIQSIILSKKGLGYQWKGRIVH